MIVARLHVKSLLQGTLLLVVAALPVIGAAQQRPAPAAKRPWEYTLQERLAKRFDRASIAARSVDPDTGQPRAGRNVIDGDKHPELFMPHELYLSVVSSYLTMDPAWVARRRRAAEDELRIFADPVEFWKKLEEGSRPFTKLLAEQDLVVARYRIADADEQRVLRERIDAEQVKLCGARTDALAAVVAAIGRDVFYRFLYEIVAPTHGQSSDTAEDETARLLFVERGCR